MPLNTRRKGMIFKFLISTDSGIKPESTTTMTDTLSCRLSELAFLL